MSSPEIAFVALGSNLGDSVKLIESAFRQLQALSDKPILKSSLVRSWPVDCPPGSPPFVNAVAALEPGPHETPLSLLHELRRLEREAGRPPKKIQNEPRLLDLDLIAFGARTAESSELTLPHPRAHLRVFVLLPMSEIAPGFVLPGQIKTVRQLLDEQK